MKKWLISQTGSRRCARRRATNDNAKNSRDQAIVRAKGTSVIPAASTFHGGPP